MPLSVFNHYVSDYPEVGQTLVHNTFSGAFVVLDDATVAALRKDDRGERLSDGERAMVDDPELRDPDVAIVVDDLEAEEAEFQAWFRDRRDRRALDVIVGVNLACNFECSYCCQAGVLDGTVMKTEVAEATADWLSARAREAGVASVRLSFVGGEPLLHPQRVELIARRVRAALPDGVGFGFTLITNGYFLTGAMLDRLIPLGLVGAQVTLDGDQSSHCKSRISKRGEDTYRRIFDHAVAASHRIKVNINGNYQADTISGFTGLIDELAAAGLDPGSRIGFSPALEALSAPDGAAYGSCTWAGSDTSRKVELHDAILRAGFGTPDLGAVGPCELHDRHAYAIDPAGTIYKCPGFLGFPEWGIGHVERGLDVDRYEHFLSLTPKSQPCGGCSDRPNCGGGCLAAEWLRTGSTDGVNCEKGYFDQVREDAAIRRYELALADNPAEAAARFLTSRAGLSRRRDGTRSVRSAALRVIAA